MLLDLQPLFLLRMACYAGVSREEATEKLAQNSLFATPHKDLEDLFLLRMSLLIIAQWR
jgi:hypothetical protein